VIQAEAVSALRKYPEYGQRPWPSRQFSDLAALGNRDEGRIHDPIVVRFAGLWISGSLNGTREQRGDFQSRLEHRQSEDAGISKRKPIVNNDTNMRSMPFIPSMLPCWQIGSSAALSHLNRDAATANRRRRSRQQGPKAQGRRCRGAGRSPGGVFG